MGKLVNGTLQPILSVVTFARKENLHARPYTMAKITKTPKRFADWDEKLAKGPSAPARSLAPPC